MEKHNEIIQLHIGGMTCVNCQNKIEKKLLRTKGVVSAKVSYTRETAEIEYDEAIVSPKEITAVINGLGYEVLLHRKAAGPDMTRIICLLVIIVSLYAVLQSLGILNLLAPSQLADTKMGYGMLFVIGLITSVHCIAMCGGINLSQCLPQKERVQPEGGRLEFLMPFSLYHGRWEELLSGQTERLVECEP